MGSLGHDRIALNSDSDDSVGLQTKAKAPWPLKLFLSARSGIHQPKENPMSKTKDQEQPEVAQAEEVPQPPAGNIDAEAIQSSTLAAEMSPKQVAKLIKIVTPSYLLAGEFLLEEGYQDDTLYVVTEGQLEVVKATGGGDWVTLQLLQPGDMVGVLGFFEGVSHSAAIRATSDCKLFGLRRKTFERLLKRWPNLDYKIMRAIIRNVHDILSRMNLQYVEMMNYINKQHGRY
jgi:CRP/FNR family transcriptional regulator, cyclic AMP receptor protein